MGGDFVWRTILRCGRYQNMQRIYQGIFFLAVTGLAFGSFVALDRLIAALNIGPSSSNEDASFHHTGD
jgi:hypothetical protein